MEDMGPNTAFKPIITTKRDGSNDENVSLAIICSGKTSYDIAATLKENEEIDKKTAIVRIEELLPFPESLLKEQLAKFTGLKKVRITACSLRVLICFIGHLVPRRAI